MFRFKDRLPTLLLLALTGSAYAQPDEVELPIRPVVQQTYVWCWVAVGEMVFNYLGVPNVNPVGNYQCGIVGLLAAGTQWEACAYSCRLCTVPAGSAQGMINMLESYPVRVAQVLGRDVDGLDVRHVWSPLRPRQIIAAIDDEMPVVAGISPLGRPLGSAASQHVALIVGYRASGTSLELRVNDPYPFPVEQNPYLRAGGTPRRDGSYWIDYRVFRDRLQWAESFLLRPRPVYAPELGRSCCTNFGRCGPFLNQRPLPIGSACSCGMAGGLVCR